MSEDFISREAVKQLLRMEMKFSLEAMVADPEVIPSADVRPNIHGHWKKAKKGITAGELSNLFKCSCCNYELYDDEFNFCPNCGADMREPIGEKGTT